jgi:hypothetical protein
VPSFPKINLVRRPRGARHAAEPCAKGANDHRGTFGADC